MSARSQLREIIFEADTPAGKAFDILLILSVLVSILAVILESVARIEVRFGVSLRRIEWFFTILFSIEYLLRLWTVEKPQKYAISFFGLVDLLAVLPTYVGFLFAGAHYFLIIRILRVLRIFRVLKLVYYIVETEQLISVVKTSGRKILVFLVAVLSLVVLLGSFMYIIEGADSGFTSIPRSIYWAIVTLTTVGYGDISPQTNLGQGLAAVIMILGYSLIVVPTGFISAAAANQLAAQGSGVPCPSCGKKGHDNAARFCKYCGMRLNRD